MEISSNSEEVDNLEQTLKNSDSYVHDMLKFYEEGWDARAVDDLEKFTSRLKANVVFTLTYINEVLAYFKELNLHPKTAHIKLQNPNSQAVLISVPVEDYLNKSLLQVYNKTHQIEQSSRSDNYRVSFSITYDDGNLDYDCLISDGFVKTHSLTYD